jgi:phosphatidylglycerol:prolipoprotein diacylglycerol transferase
VRPHVLGLTTYFILWLLGAIVGVAVAVRDARRAGFSLRAATLGACTIAVTILLGSKLLYLAEHVLYPHDAALPWQQDDWRTLLRYGFRIPGGILLMAPVLPLLCRSLRLPTLQFADVILPGVAVALVFIRVGCFLNGCCFGRVTDFPVAITFPPGAHVYDWQLSQELISVGAAHTLPVHPLQLYFAALGVLLYACSRRWLQTRRFAGQVWINFYVLFFAGTFLLEQLRPQPLHLNLILATVVTGAALVSGAGARMILPAAARAPASARPQRL